MGKQLNSTKDDRTVMVLAKGETGLRAAGGVLSPKSSPISNDGRTMGGRVVR